MAGEALHFGVVTASPLNYELRQIAARIPQLPAGSAFNAGLAFQGAITLASGNNNFNTLLLGNNTALRNQGFNGTRYEYYTLIAQFAVHNLDAANSLQIRINGSSWKRVLPKTYYAETGIEIPLTQMSIAAIGGDVADVDVNVWYYVSQK